jgi:hypothetical protein
MQLINRTRFPAAWTLGFARNGREVVVVVAKATYAFDAASGEVRPGGVQDPLVKADEFTGTPGLSAVLRETDFATFKPRCDVLLNGSAHAPAGTRVRSLPVGMRVGPVAKAFQVSGDRVWKASLLMRAPSEPEPFASMPISYDRAFGGVDAFGGDDVPVAYYAANPVGRGYHRRTSSTLVDGTPLPNTEELDRAVDAPDGRYVPMSFGALGRNFPSRLAHAGTYDERWQATQAPFWPEDFSYEYFQAAPVDQQMPYPRGGEPVTLKNLTPGGHAGFHLPALSLSVLANFHEKRERTFEMAVDTVLIEPDQGRLTMACRVGIPMARSLFDLREIVLDTTTAIRTRPFHNGKPHYRSLGDYVRARSRGKIIK